jgi:phage terminase small subunit
VKSKRKAIHDGLLAQLERNHTSTDYYRNLVDDYMALYDAKTKLIADIKKRGVTVEVVSSAGRNIKKNDSVGELVKVNAQMLKLLSELGIKPAQDYGPEDAL